MRLATPGFVAVATNGALKHADHMLAGEMGCDLMFCNSYHLLLQPGPELIEAAGGLHKFMNRTRPIITDSGGGRLRGGLGLGCAPGPALPVGTPRSQASRSSRSRTNRYTTSSI